MYQLRNSSFLQALFKKDSLPNDMQTLAEIRCGACCAVLCVIATPKDQFKPISHPSAGYSVIFSLKPGPRGNAKM